MDIILAVLSTLCLMCFLLYVRYFYIGHWSIYELNNAHKTFAWPRKIISILAAVGLLICLFSGINAMLFWFPEDWGTIGGEGEYVSYKLAIASVLVLFASLFTFVALINFAKDQKDGVYYSIIAEGYKKILATQSNKQRLESLKFEYEEATKKLEKTLPLNEDRRVHKSPYMPCKEYWKLMAYEDLITDINDMVSTAA